MRKLCHGLCFATMVMLVACGDSGSNSGDIDTDGEWVEQNSSDSDDSSSSVIPESSTSRKVLSSSGSSSSSATLESSSSKEQESSSGEKSGSSKGPESSSVDRSSSSKGPVSSSEETSSSSKELESSSEEMSSSSKEPESSSEVMSSSSKKPESSSEGESSSSEEPESSSEESSSSVSWFSSDASIYDATANTLTDLRDGQVYRTTTIDNLSERYSEVWMAENLNLVTENSWCGGGNVKIEGDCSVYGRLYTWAAVLGKTEEECGYGNECGLSSSNIRGVCPKGWHLPSKAEFESLIDAVGGKIFAGKMLKSAGGWNEYGGGSGDGTDSYLFSALPAGYKNFNGNFYSEGNGAYFWSSAEYDGNGAYLMAMYYNYERAYLYNERKSNGFSVRCLKD